MKKLLASILILVYFVVSTGFVVSVHYCMDEVNSVELGADTESHCNGCGMKIIESNNGCCKDEVKVVKMQVDQTIAKLVKADFSLSLPPVLYTTNLFTTTFNKIKIDEPTAHGPPISEQDTYLQNCVFRI